MNENTYQSHFFAEALWPRTGLARDLTLILAGSWLVALLARVEIPLWPVPITGQTFGVLSIGALLGKRLGTASMLAYLAQGSLGLPVYAGGAVDRARLIGPTGGYLVGFVVAAFVVGWLSERGWDKRLATAALAMLAGNVVIYCFGLPWLANFVGWGAAWKSGLTPFIAGDLLKIALAALTLPCGWALIDTHKRA